MNDHGGLDLSEVRGILKRKPTGFSDRLDVGCERERRGKSDFEGFGQLGSGVTNQDGKGCRLRVGGKQELTFRCVIV